ncbi:helix-turn-helix domain-containing protein [Salegentibacter sp. LM13S]|uniref:helix-turn-helix domain-containing protein n=1 Tax=Salegentibacter lacus TaxID=2873599 RepID=UPI001CCFA39A|nr:helix-turn-helix domain-containing protein [Salegentibacter lacus]MBZ9632605.1 helix-turn-helix domain-containing protein [Salegentibacter lacus]
MRRKFIEIDNYSSKELDEKFEKLEKAISNMTPAPNFKNKLLTKRETANLFKVSQRTLHNWNKAHILKSYSIGNRVYYKYADIQSALMKTEN